MMMSHEKRENDVRTMGKNYLSARYQTLIDQASDPLFVVSLETGKLISYNEKARDLLGYHDDEMSAFQISDWDQGFPTLENYHHFTQQLETIPIAYDRCYIRKDRSVCTVSLSAMRLMAEGEAYCYLCIKEANTIALYRENEALKQKYESLFDNSPDPYIIIDTATHKIVECNQAAQNILKGKLSEILGLTIGDISPLYQPTGELSTQKVQHVIDETQKQGTYRFEWVHRNLLGESFWVEVTDTIVKTEGQEVFFVMWRDITEKKALTQKIENESVRKELALKVGTIGIWEWRYASNTLVWDDVMHDIYGVQYSSEQNPYTLWRDAVDPHDIQRVQEHLFWAREHDGEYNVTFSITTPEGVRKYIHAIGRNQYDREGLPLLMVGVNIDITQQKMVELAAQKSKIYYQTLLDSASDAVHIIDAAGKLITYSRSFANHLGYEYDEIRAMHVPDWDCGRVPECLRHDIKDFLDAPQTFETKHRKKDGTILDVQINAKGIELEGQRYLYASARDITEANQLKQEIIKERNFVSAIVSNANAIIAVINAVYTNLFVVIVIPPR